MTPKTRNTKLEILSMSKKQEHMQFKKHMHNIDINIISYFASLTIEKQFKVIRIKQQIFKQYKNAICNK